MGVKLTLVRHYIAASKKNRKTCKLLVMTAIRETSVSKLKLMLFSVRGFQVLFEENRKKSWRNKVS